MVDPFTPDERSRIMALVRSRGNRSTEQLVAAHFRRQKVTGWRRHVSMLGKPDFVFRKQRVAIFVDGCFWHGCRNCSVIPVNNRPYWERKINTNMKRDALNTERLRSRGWTVIRVWEHDLKGRKLPETIRRIKKVLART